MGSSAEERRHRLVVRSGWDAVDAPSAAEVNRICCKFEAMQLLPAEITCSVAHDPQNGRGDPDTVVRVGGSIPESARSMSTLVNQFVVLCLNQGL